MTSTLSFQALSIEHLRDSRGAIQLYDGMYDFPQPLTPATIPVRLRLKEVDLCFDLRSLLDGGEDSLAWLVQLSVAELLQFCTAADCRAELVRGDLRLHVWPATPLDLGTCYVQRLDRAEGTFCPVVAFNETQPQRYKAELVAVLKQTSWSASAT